MLVVNFLERSDTLVEKRLRSSEYCCIGHVHTRIGINGFREPTLLEGLCVVSKLRNALESC